VTPARLNRLHMHGVVVHASRMLLICTCCCCCQPVCAASNVLNCMPQCFFAHLTSTAFVLTVLVVFSVLHLPFALCVCAHQQCCLQARRQTIRQLMLASHCMPTPSHPPLHVTRCTSLAAFRMCTNCAACCRPKLSQPFHLIDLRLLFGRSSLTERCVDHLPAGSPSDDPQADAGGRRGSDQRSKPVRGLQAVQVTAGQQPA
jgi:hypothetical protein